MSPDPNPATTWTGPQDPAARLVLTPEALAFVATLARRFHWELEVLLARREARQRAWDAGIRPSEDPASHAIREGDWTVQPLTGTLRPERTGPAESHWIAGTLADGVRTFLADFEDRLAPAPAALLAGQAALAAAVRSAPVQPIARPRGLHQSETHLLVDGLPVPAALFDAGLFLFHNAATLLERGAAPWLSPAKLEDAAEARWWQRVLTAAERLLDLPAGCIRVSVGIETQPAVRQMDELLHELRTRAVSLDLDPRSLAFSQQKVHRREPGPARPFDLAEALRRADRVRRLRGLPAGPAPAASDPEPTGGDAALRWRLRSGLAVLEAFLQGRGQTELEGRTLDGLSLESGRMEVWRCLHHALPVDRHGILDRALFHRFVLEALHQVRAEVGTHSFAAGRFLEAADLLEELVLAPDPAPFFVPFVQDRRVVDPCLGATA